MDEMGFERLIDAPTDILGKPLVLMHWTGATEAETLTTKEAATMALEHGWTRYRLAAAPEPKP